MTETTAAGRQVEAHDHVTLDEDVFCAYQEVALAAGYIDDPDPSLAFALARLSDALGRSRSDSEVDPRHHLPREGASTLTTEVCVYEVPEGFVVASGGCWCEGVYATREQAERVGRGEEPEKKRGEP